MTYDTAELKRLMEAGTPGPWAVHVGDYNRHTIKDSNGWSLAGMDTLAPNGPRFKAGSDAALIVAAVNALPDLLARVEELEGALKNLSGAIDQMWNDPEGRTISERHAKNITGAQILAAIALKGGA